MVAVENLAMLLQFPQPREREEGEAFGDLICPLLSGGAELEAMLQATEPSKKDRTLLTGTKRYLQVRWEYIRAKLGLVDVKEEDAATFAAKPK